MGSCESSVWPSGLLNIKDIITYGWATHNKDAHLITRARSYGGKILFVGQEGPWRRSRLDMASSLRVFSLHMPKAVWELTVISLDTFLPWELSRHISNPVLYTQNYTFVHLRSIFTFRKCMSTSVYEILQGGCSRLGKLGQRKIMFVWTSSFMF